MLFLGLSSEGSTSGRWAVLSGGLWHPVAAYLAIGCLIPVLVTAKIKTGRTVTDFCRRGR
jgi:hypothetical protein